MNQITYDANNQLSSHGHPKKRQVTSALPRLPDRLPGDPVRGWDVMVKTSISGWVYEITFRRISKWGRFLYGWCLLFLFIFDERSYHPAERVLIFVIWMCLKFDVYPQTAIFMRPWCYKDGDFFCFRPPFFVFPMEQGIHPGSHLGQF